MRHSPETQGRFIYYLRESDLLRAALCLVFMVVLVFSGLTLWLALPLPILTYLGLSLVLSPSSSSPETGTPPILDRPRPHDPDDLRSFDECNKLFAEFCRSIPEVQDPEIKKRLQIIEGQIDKILSAIKRDEKFEASRSLLWHIDFSRQLLAQYVKVRVHLGLVDSRTEERILRNFTRLSNRFDLFWNELNRQEVVNLEVLNETLEMDMDDLGVEGDETSGDVADDTSVDFAAVMTAAAAIESESLAVPSSNGVYLTPREMEVLIPLVNGCTDQAIGFELGISTRTSEAHARAIREKFGVPSRTAAAVYAVIHGIVRPDQISFGRCYGADAEST